jgi:thiamine biosynthesis lipoprotein
MRIRKVPTALAALAIAAIAAAGQGAALKTASRNYFALGTICSVSVTAERPEELLDACAAKLSEIEASMSRSIPSSDVARVSAQAGRGGVRVSADTLLVARAAKKFAELSNGAFDPTIGPLVSLWGIGGDSPRRPSDQEIGKALKLVDWRDLAIDLTKGEIRLARAGQELDFGAIAKGYAADALRALIRKAGAARAIINLGGNILMYGAKEDGSPWRVGIQVPDAASQRGEYLCIVEIEGGSVVTSGVYERFFVNPVDGKSYHHILSTATGFPIENGILSVSVLCDSSTIADGLSTTAFALGPERSFELAKRLGAELVYITDDARILTSQGLKGKIRLTARGAGYRIEE